MASESGRPHGRLHLPGGKGAIDVMQMQQATMQESILDHIKKDHEKVMQEIGELEKRVQGTSRSDDPVFVPMKKELLGHMAAEEKLLYPLLEPQMKDKIKDAIREHDEVRKHLDHLSAGGSMSESEWSRHLQMMKQGIMHHVQEEEGEFFSTARRVIGEDRLRSLGPEFEREEKKGM